MKPRKKKVRIVSMLVGLAIITVIVFIYTKPGLAFNSECTATSDLQTNTLHIPSLELNGNEYWVDFHLLSWSPVQLQLQDFGGKSTCLDDDIEQGIYRSCNYFPLDTGNMWSFNDITWTVSGDTHAFTGGTGKRVTNMGGYCVSYDNFLMTGSNGIEFFGFYDREKKTFGEFPVQTFTFIPDEIRVGDSWSFSVPSEFSVTYHFEGPETVTVPAGTFSGSLKIRANIVDLDDSPGTYTTFFWFARDVGIIKAHRTSESPIGFEGCFFVTSEKPLVELQSAWIDGVSYP